MKACTKCGLIKDKTEFNFRKESKDNLTSWCRSCLKEKDLKWNLKNKEYLKNKRKNEREENPEKYKLKFKKWYDENHESQLQRAAEYRKNNPEKINESQKKWASKKRQTDINYKILTTLRNRINNVIRRQGGEKAFSAIQLTGCSVTELKKYLQEKFKPGMSWSNHGEWHIDHIMPCASFDLTDPDQQKKCFHYTNLQPLWAHENILKRAKII